MKDCFLLASIVYVGYQTYTRLVSANLNISIAFDRLIAQALLFFHTYVHVKVGSVKLGIHYYQCDCIQLITGVRFTCRAPVRFTSTSPGINNNYKLQSHQLKDSLRIEDVIGADVQPEQKKKTNKYLNGSFYLFVKVRSAIISFSCWAKVFKRQEAVYAAT